MTAHFEWVKDAYMVVRLGRSRHLVGWFGPLDDETFWEEPENPTMRWYARTAGSSDLPPNRAEFATQEEAKAFVQFMSHMENPDVDT